ncbi:hypothetical protein BKA82DRAFT_377885 [Pisolithus tinctorius]|uniref:Uncharacterized protein n=1 Tax=Pisolithus tinctorius Marx 270 TaxID=870435 RepID=A0A0C3JFU6_PISTI|nr:hypothetical protein BKA82DRAFT_377885 [Pisolithus tinctorius]KIO07953.1 hypothetical protein M404DRAFT_377885 [Pisolithus tinctorius Marx 270]
MVHNEDQSDHTQRLLHRVGLEPHGSWASVAQMLQANCKGGHLTIACTVAFPHTYLFCTMLCSSFSLCFHLLLFTSVHNNAYHIPIYNCLRKQMTSTELKIQLHAAATAQITLPHNLAVMFTSQ